MKFDILNRFTGFIQFTAEIECAPDELPSVKLGLAIKCAIRACANLAGAYLAGANLARADLADADLADADLADAYLADAYLVRANLAGAKLADAYLAHANLAGANLTHANLAGANLAGANLAGANLAGAENAELAIASTRILPEGDLIGWKKCQNGILVKLRIPESAKRSHAFGRKCRAEYADVIEVIGGEVGITEKHGPRTEYRAGERIRPDSFDENWIDECSHGIHFFITRAEAEAYDRHTGNSHDRRTAN